MVVSTISESTNACCYRYTATGSHKQQLQDSRPPLDLVSDLTHSTQLRIAVKGHVIWVFTSPFQIGFLDLSDFSVTDTNTSRTSLLSKRGKRTYSTIRRSTTAHMAPQYNHNKGTLGAPVSHLWDLYRTLSRSVEILMCLRWIWHYANTKGESQHFASYTYLLNQYPPHWRAAKRKHTEEYVTCQGGSIKTIPELMHQHCPV